MSRRRMQAAMTERRDRPRHGSPRARALAIWPRCLRSHRLAGPALAYTVYVSNEKDNSIT